MKAEVYSDKYKKEWDEFVSVSKNGTFLFYRDFMEYHADRFRDYSFLFYDDKDKLIALLPGNINNGIYYSHQGLTYGGLITSAETKTSQILEIFNILTNTLSHQGVKEIIYKTIPHIYHTIPAEEDLYAIFLHKGSLVGRGLSSTIRLSEEKSYSKLRKRRIKKAEENNLVIKECDDFDAFWQILSNNLAERYNAKPTHTVDEILFLRNKFPSNIKLYGAFSSENKLVAGIVTFESYQVMHLQYIAATGLGKDNGAIDLLVDHISEEASSSNKIYLDFGISTENNGLTLNNGLIRQKEGFGARGVTYDIYSIKLN